MHGNIKIAATFNFELSIIRKLQPLTLDILRIFKLTYSTSTYSQCMFMFYLKLDTGLTCNRFRHWCSNLHGLCFSSAPLCSLEFFLCHSLCSKFRWCFQGEETNAEDISPAKLLACYDNAQSKILGLSRRSLYTDGLDAVRSLPLPCCSCQMLSRVGLGRWFCDWWLAPWQVSAGLLKLWGAVGAACTETPSETTTSPSLRFVIPTFTEQSQILVSY